MKKILLIIIVFVALKSEAQKAKIWGWNGGDTSRTYGWSIDSTIPKTLIEEGYRPHIITHNWICICCPAVIDTISSIYRASKILSSDSVIIGRIYCIPDSIAKKLFDVGTKMIWGGGDWKLKFNDGLKTFIIDSTGKIISTKLK